MAHAGMAILTTRHPERKLLVGLTTGLGEEDLRVSLDTELQFFGSHRAEWLKDHEGDFVLIKGTEFSFHRTDDEAYRTGVEKYGADCDIFIKQVLPEDIVEDSMSLLYGLVNVET